MKPIGILRGVRVKLTLHTCLAVVLNWTCFVNSDLESLVLKVTS